MFKLKRVYEVPSRSDGFRVLVDRLWPRGLSKEKAETDIWLKEISPSTALRKWFNHDPKKWTEFQIRYKRELSDKQELLQQLQVFEEKHKTVTLLYGSKDTLHNEAVVLLNVLEQMH